MTYLNTLGFFLELVRSSELEQRGVIFLLKETTIMSSMVL